MSELGQHTPNQADLEPLERLETWVGIARDIAKLNGAGDSAWTDIWAFRVLVRHQDLMELAREHMGTIDRHRAGERHRLENQIADLKTKMSVIDQERASMRTAMIQALKSELRRKTQQDPQ